MRVGELARRTGVSADTIRLYEARGLVSAQRRANGYRDFDASMVTLVNLVRNAQSMGFSLAEIGELVQGMGNSGMDTRQVEAVVREKIAQIDSRMNGLAALRETLVQQLEVACPIRQQVLRLPTKA